MCRNHDRLRIEEDVREQNFTVLVFEEPCFFVEQCLGHKILAKDSSAVRTGVDVKEPNEFGEHRQFPFAHGEEGVVEIFDSEDHEELIWAIFVVNAEHECRLEVLEESVRDVDAEFLEEDGRRRLGLDVAQLIRDEKVVDGIGDECFIGDLSVDGVDEFGAVEIGHVDVDLVFGEDEAWETRREISDFRWPRAIHDRVDENHDTADDEDETKHHDDDVFGRGRIMLLFEGFAAFLLSERDFDDRTFFAFHHVGDVGRVCSQASFDVFMRKLFSWRNSRFFGGAAQTIFGILRILGHA